jgi:pSer/pThr/pTyr-binding forkhead associated (FHA) protein
MFILNTGRLTNWLEGSLIYLGRRDSAGQVGPTVDLSGDGGHAAGVSRWHARIIHQPDGFYLEDMGSVNGTCVNRHLIPQGQAVALHHQDEIRLGNAVLRVILGDN